MLEWNDYLSESARMATGAYRQAYRLPSEPDYPTSTSCPQCLMEITRGVTVDPRVTRLLPRLADQLWCSPECLTEWIAEEAASIFAPTVQEAVYRDGQVEVDV